MGVAADKVSLLCCMGMSEIMLSIVLRVVQQAVRSKVETVLLVTRSQQDSGACVGTRSGAP